MYIGALKFSHSYFNIYVAWVAPLGFFYTCLRSAPALLDEDIIALRNYIIYHPAKFLVVIWRRVKMTFEQIFHITRTTDVHFVEIPVLNAFKRVSTWPLTESYTRCYYRAIKTLFCIIFRKNIYIYFDFRLSYRIL